MQQLVEHPVPENTPVDFLPLNGTDFVEFYVGNAKQAAYYYRAAFGFKLVAYRGPETGTRDRVDYVLQQGKIRFVLTTPLSPDGEIAEHIKRHGDGVREIALWVDDAESAYRETTRRGARGVQEPTVREDQDGRVRISAIAAYGDTIHAFVERKDYRGVFLPGFRAADGDDPIARPTGLVHIDHMVGNVGWGQMDAWVGLLSRRHGLPALPALRRQRHQHRIFGAHVQGDVQRQRPREVPHQRARRRQEEIADRRVPGILRRPWRATYRHGHRRHHRHGVQDARAGHRIPARPHHLLRRSRKALRQDRRTGRPNWPT